MEFPKLDPALQLARLQPPAGKIRMVLDTDTYNEIDDQFAVVYSLLSPDKLGLEAIYAAPFHNDRSSGPGDGMEKSYEEILRLLARLDVRPEGLVFRGSTGFLPDRQHPDHSAAALDLIERAMAGGNEPLYVLAIGAITNVASAILIEPKIVERIVVVWLGGQPLHWPSAREFNLQQDLVASQVMFDCGVPLMMIPCNGVASHLLTTWAEIERYVKGRGVIGDYLAQIFDEYQPSGVRAGEKIGWSKVIWDISGVAWLINGGWAPGDVVNSPILTDQYTWSFDKRRHWVRFANQVHRDPIFRDLFGKLAACC